jgi:hypothetical protein
MLAELLVAFTAGLGTGTAEASFAAEACGWLKGTAQFKVRCPPVEPLAVVADAFGLKQPVLAIVSTNEVAHRATLVVVSRRQDLPDSRYTRGWHVTAVADWGVAEAPIRLAVLPKGHFERAPPFTRSRDTSEVDEMDTLGEAILVCLPDRRLWVLALTQAGWRKVYLGIPHVD